MTNVTFYRGTDADHEGITDNGVLSFNPMRGTIHLGNGTTADQFLNRISVMADTNKIGAVDVTEATTDTSTDYGYKYTYQVGVPGIIVHIGDWGYSNTPNSSYGNCVYNISMTTSDLGITSTFTLTTSSRAWTDAKVPVQTVPRFKYAISYIPCFDWYYVSFEFLSYYF